MRRIPYTLLLALGTIIILAGIGAWYWISALGCAMNTTGCSDLRIPMPWEDPELFALLGPVFLVGAVMLGVGVWGRRR